MTDRDDDSADVMLADARGDNFGDMMTAAHQQVMVPGVHQLSPRQVGDLFGSITTAQPVIKERDHKRLMQIIKTLAQSFGENYIYSWDVKDRNSKRADGKSTIEGPTIQLANDLAREFGNNCLDIREIEGPTHWVFYARFTDLQTGYTLTRAFRQRKNAMAGKYEDDRKLDMAYQMGQSKALRNVVVNALRNYVEYMMEEAKRALPDKIKADPDKYWQAIDRGFAQFHIDQSAAEGMVGRARAEWTTRDVAQVFSAIKGIAEGLVSAADAFPQEGAQIDPETGEVSPKSATKTGAGSGTGPKAAAAKPAAAKPEEGGEGTAISSEPSSGGAPSEPAQDGAAKANGEQKPPAAEKAKPAASAAQASPAAAKAAKPAAKKPAALFE